MIHHRTKSFLEDNISKLLIRQSVPASVAMLVVALYNVIDTIFVGQAVGHEAIAALTLTMPFFLFISAIGISIGIGCSSIFARSLGSGNRQKANASVGNSIVITIILTFVTILSIFILKEKILYFLGAREIVLKLALDFLNIMLIGFPFLIFLTLFNSLLRSEGNAKMAMLTMLLSAVINIILDILFIMIFHWGVKGAAIATTISHIISFGITIYYLFYKDSAIQIKKEHLRLELSITKEILALSAASFARHVSMSLMNAIMNKSLFYYGGDTAITIFGIISRIISVGFMPMLGINQGMSSIIGQNYGATYFSRVKQTMYIAGKYSILISSGFVIITSVFAVPIISIFTNNVEIIERGRYIMILCLISMPIVPIQINSTVFFQSTGKAGYSLLLGLMRQIFILIPLVIILPPIFGLWGVWIAMPLADIISTVISYFLLKKELYKMK